MSECGIYDRFLTLETSVETFCTRFRTQFHLGAKATDEPHPRAILGLFSALVGALFMLAHESEAVRLGEHKARAFQVVLFSNSGFSCCC